VGLRGVLYFELLPCGQTIDAKKYCAQFERKFEAGSCGKAARIDEQVGHRLASRQRHTTHCFGDQAEIKEL